MEIEKLAEANKVWEKILRAKAGIGQLEKLITSCSISCVLRGTPGFHTTRIEYESFDKYRIKVFVEAEKIVLEKELEELEALLKNI